MVTLQGTLFFRFVNHGAQFTLPLRIQLVQEHFKVFFILALNLEPLVLEHLI